MNKLIILSLSAACLFGVTQASYAADTAMAKDCSKQDGADHKCMPKEPAPQGTMMKSDTNSGSMMMMKQDNTHQGSMMMMKKDDKKKESESQ